MNFLKRFFKKIFNPKKQDELKFNNKFLRQSHPLGIARTREEAIARIQGLAKAIKKGKNK
jgi:hypothetical protein